MTLALVLLIALAHLPEVGRGWRGAKRRFGGE
jgi:hypothetical protein